MLFPEKDTSSKSGPSNSPATMTGNEEDTEREREKGWGKPNRGKY